MQESGHCPFIVPLKTLHSGCLNGRRLHFQMSDYPCEEELQFHWPWRHRLQALHSHLENKGGWC